MLRYIEHNSQRWGYHLKTVEINTNAINEMLKRVQHDKKKYVIPNLFRNLEFGNDNKLIVFVLVNLLCPLMKGGD
jgi:hypothetical protein